MNDETFFKFVFREDLDLLPLERIISVWKCSHRDVENQDIRDAQKGESQIFLRNGRDQVAVHITSGFNCALFCGTAVSERSNAHMQRTFGDQCIKVSPLSEFMDALRHRLKARSVFVRDVIYTNRKAFVVDKRRATELRSLLNESERLIRRD